MKILFDTSALLPGFRYPDLREKALGHVIWAGHTPVVTDYILDELRENIHKRYSDAQKAVALDLLLQIMSMNVLEVKLWDEYASHLEEAFKWVPEKDAPVLATLMLPDIDYLVVRDEKDFLNNPKLEGTPWREQMITPQEVFELF